MLGTFLNVFLIINHYSKYLLRVYCMLLTICHSTKKHNDYQSYLSCSIKYHTVGTMPKSNIKIVETGKIDTHTQCRRIYLYLRQIVCLCRKMSRIVFNFDVKNWSLCVLLDDHCCHGNKIKVCLFSFLFRY